MSFTKPYTYVDGQVLTNTNQESNEDAIQEYVNQEIITSDIQNQSLDGRNIAQPRFYAIDNSIDCVTKTIKGFCKLRYPNQFNYFTSTTKPYDQISTTNQDWQHIPNAGTELVIQGGMGTPRVQIYALLKAFADENIGPVAQGGAGNNMWENAFRLQVETSSTVTSYAGTRQYVFSPIGSTGLLDPGAQNQAAQHRSLMFSRALDLPPGRHKLNLVVNAKSEKGNVSCQSFIAEVFYI